MFQRINSKVAAIGTLLVLLIPLATSSGVFAANIEDSVKCGANTLSITKTIDCEKLGDEGTDKANKLIAKIINILSIIVGIIAVIMIIYAGFKYITSGGNQENVKAAKNILIYAIIGLVIVALAQIIVQFVLKEATQATKPGPCDSIIDPDQKRQCEDLLKRSN